MSSLRFLFLLTSLWLSAFPVDAQTGRTRAPQQGCDCSLNLDSLSSTPLDQVAREYQRLRNNRRCTWWSANFQPIAEFLGDTLACGSYDRYDLFEFLGQPHKIVSQLDGSAILIFLWKERNEMSFLEKEGKIISRIRKKSER